MSWPAVILFTTRLLSLAIFIQSIEVFYLSRQTTFQKIFGYRNIKSDLQKGLPLPRHLIQILFADQTLSALALIQIALAFVSWWSPNGWPFLIIFLIHFIICIRFRGTFNGGSDMMTFVVLTGVLLSFFFHSKTEPAVSLDLGFIYITIHLLFSYFKAGFVKIKQPDWQQGKALAVFLQRSLLSDIRQLGIWLSTKPILGLILSWIVLVFELSVVALLFFPQLVLPYFILAFLFHFLVYISFGLNRFFWIWMSAWPAALFTLKHLH